MQEQRYLHRLQDVRCYESVAEEESTTFVVLTYSAGIALRGVTDSHSKSLSEVPPLLLFNEFVTPRRANRKEGKWPKVEKSP